MLAKAASGSLKNITPKREKAASNRPHPRSSVCVSVCRKVIAKLGFAHERWSATSSIGAEISTPTTEPVDPSRSARASEV